ncbi:thioredoxin [Salegentibacter holothuriorum]|uniref:Thioredoxin n=2 Tax=Salegentibacter holothuriorum TaxID=241145 RepID=A0A1T5BSL2_9FLAO|nr:thioredoxin [Salegentibacter holothuriorum]
MAVFCCKNNLVSTKARNSVTLEKLNLIIMKSNFSEIIKDDKAVLVDFHADWCGPCKTLAPILKDVKAELGDSVKIVKIDVDKNQELAGKYQVRGVPTMILFKNGQQLWRQSGVLQKAEIIEVINSKS